MTCFRPALPPERAVSFTLLLWLVPASTGHCAAGTNLHVTTQLNKPTNQPSSRLRSHPFHYFSYIPIKFCCKFWDYCLDFNSECFLAAAHKEETGADKQGSKGPQTVDQVPQVVPPPQWMWEVFLQWQYLLLHVAQDPSQGALLQLTSPGKSIWTSKVLETLSSVLDMSLINFGS